MSTEAERALQEYERLRAEVARLLAEVAEHRAARGIEAPAPWRPSEEALWARDVGAPDEHGGHPEGWVLVERHRDGERWYWCWVGATCADLAHGTEATCLGALAAAEAALAGGGT